MTAWAAVGPIGPTLPTPGRRGYPSASTTRLARLTLNGGSRPVDTSRMPDAPRSPGSLLVAGGVISPEQLAWAESAAVAEGTSLLEVLHRHSLATADQLRSAAAAARGAQPASPPAPAQAPGGGTLGTQTVAAAMISGPAAPHLDDLLRRVVDLGGSDLHLAAGIPPAVRIHGDIKHLTEFDTLTPNAVADLVFGVLNQRQRDVFEADHELDTSYSLADVGRFRVNVFLQRGTVGAVMRVIPFETPSFESLGLPESVMRFSAMHRGLVLVTGPTGSGKSTTLASLIDIINRTRAGHIMTVEDPIEFLHTHKASVVNQREVGEDTHSFAVALKHVLRQDPDVILVGEMRDLETISTAITAAETGHLVFGTLHTQSAPQSVDRIIDVFPAHQQAQVRVQLSTALQGVVTQQLVPRASGTGRIVAAEILMATAAVRNLIREGKTHQIPSMMQSGGKHGMQTMDQSLADLVTARAITLECAVDHSHNEEDLRRLATGR
jgi:twitching motility protein PilT